MKVFGIKQNGLYMHGERANEKYRATRAIMSSAQEYREFTPYFAKEPKYVDRMTACSYIAMCLEAIRFDNISMNDITIEIREE